MSKKTYKLKYNTKKKCKTKKKYGGVLSNNNNVSQVILNNINTIINKNDPRPGIHLINHVVTQISGPASIALLRPTPDKIKEYKNNNIKLPIVLLFGDVHGSTDYMCPNCNCDDDAKQCCFEIYNKQFLQELDIIGRIYPIDYYTEFNFQPIHTHDSIGVLSSQFINKTVKNCHKKNNRIDHYYRQSCPTRFIRWHYGDSRMMIEYIESFHVIQYDLIEFYMIDILTNSDIKNFNESDYKTIGEKINKSRQIFMTRINSTLRILKRSNSDIALLYEFNNRIFNNLISLLFTPNINQLNFSIYIKEFIKQFSKNVISILFESKKMSRIYKQIQKNNIHLFNDPNILSDILTNIYIKSEDLIKGLEDIILNIPFSQLEWIKPFFTTLLLSYDTLDQQLLNTFIHPHNRIFVISFLNKIIYIMLPLFAPLMDLYILFRMIKNPTNNIPSILSIEFGGRAHIRNMINILTDPIFGYNIDINTNNIDNKYNRCITIDSKIPLIQYIKDHAKQISNNNKEYFKIYHDTIKNEWEKRKILPPPPPPLEINTEGNW